MIRVEILEQNRTALKPFVMLPFSLYAEDPHWVPPMISAQLTVLSSLKRENIRFFLVYDEDQPVARVLAGVDERLAERMEKKCGYISLFECAQKPDYARAVLDAACGFLREKGMEMVMGPASPTPDDLTKGLLVQGYEGPPVMLNAYNPPYYQEYFEKCGFTKHRDHYAYYMRMDEFDLHRIEEIVPRAKQRFGFRVEHVLFTRENEERLLRDITRVIQESFPAEWELAVPSYADVKRIFGLIRGYYRPEMTVLAYAGNRPIGFVAAFPDYNQVIKKMKGKILPLGWLHYLLGRGKINGARCSMQFVVPEYQFKAVHTAMYYEVYLGAQKIGIKWVEGSTVDETNVASINNNEKAGSHLYRIYRQFEKTL